MELATLQRQLRGVIKSTYQVSEGDDPYIRAVAESPRLALVQEIIAWWRAFGLERYCVLTVALLKRRDLFDQAVHTFIRTQRIYPFMEELGQAFLRQMSDHEDRVVASVAQFELALIRVKQDHTTEEYSIDWEHEPYTVLDSLINGLPLDEESVRGAYQTVVSREIPGLFKVIAATRR